MDIEKQIKHLSKQATQIKKVDIDAAIDSLIEAKKLMLSFNADYFGINSYIRLPLFLQKAGRMPEAQIEFEQLMMRFNRGYERRTISEKYQLCLKRQKQFDDAAIYGVLAIVYEVVGIKEHKLTRQKQTERAQNNAWRDAYPSAQKHLDKHLDYCAKEDKRDDSLILEIRLNTETSIGKILAKSSIQTLQGALAGKLNYFIDNYPDVTPQDLKKQLNEVRKQHYLTN